MGFALVFIPAHEVFGLEYTLASWLWPPFTTPLVTAAAVFAAWETAPSRKRGAGLVALAAGIIWSSLFLIDGLREPFHLSLFLMGTLGVAGGVASYGFHLKYRPAA